MSSQLAPLIGATIGTAAGAALLPLTRQQLAGAMARAGRAAEAAEAADALDERPATRVAPWHRLALIVASGLVPGVVFARVGWSINAVPPLLLVLGLIQLGYCDFVRRLLPKALVYAMSALVLGSGLAVAASNNEWVRLQHALLGGGAFFLALFVMNLLNPRWMAFGDVRLALAVGFGLAWISPVAVLEGFFVANVLAAVIGLSLIGLQRADRRSALPFGFYLALGVCITILAWS